MIALQQLITRTEPFSTVLTTKEFANTVVLSLSRCATNSNNKDNRKQTHTLLVIVVVVVVVKINELCVSCGANSLM